MHFVTRWLATIGSCLLCQAAIGESGALSVLDRVESDGVLRVCTTGDYRPFSLARADGAYEGIDIDAARELAQSLKARVEFVRTSWPRLMQDFQAGRCDIAMGGISISLERQRHADFSIPYLVDGKSAIARCADAARFQTLAQIDQSTVRVVVNPGGTNERFARSELHAAQIRVYPDNTTIFDEIVHGAADVMITDASETLVQQKLHPELCAIHPERPLSFSEKAYLLPRGDVAFKSYVDQWLHLDEKTGAQQKRLDSWLR
jgi:cyclohexadienyl dehydratase